MHVGCSPAGASVHLVRAWLWAGPVELSTLFISLCCRVAPGGLHAELLAARARIQKGHGFVGAVRTACCALTSMVCTHKLYVACVSMTFLAVFSAH